MASPEQSRFENVMGVKIGSLYDGRVSSLESRANAYVGRVEISANDFNRIVIALKRVLDEAREIVTSAVVEEKFNVNVVEEFFIKELRTRVSKSLSEIKDDSIWVEDTIKIDSLRLQVFVQNYVKLFAKIENERKKTPDDDQLPPLNHFSPDLLTLLNHPAAKKIPSIKTWVKELAEEFSIEEPKDKLVFDENSDEAFQYWKDDILNKELRHTHPKGMYYELFMAEIRVLSAAEKTHMDDLNEVYKHFEIQLQNIGDIKYEGSGAYNEQFLVAQKIFIEKEKEKIKSQIERLTPTLSDQEEVGEVEEREEKELTPDQNTEVALAMYKDLQVRNPSLPDFENLTPADLSLFHKNLWIAIAKKIRELLDITTSGGKTAFNLPSSDTLLVEDVKFDIAIKADLADDKRNLEFFFQNFPWDKLVPGITKSEIYKVYQDVWRLRLLHISLTHNSTAKFRAIQSNYQSPEFPEQVRKLVADLAKDGGGYGEIEPYFQNEYEVGTPEAKLLGETDESWTVPQLEQFFISMADQFFIELIFDTQAVKEKVQKYKSFFISMIPESSKIDMSLVDLAWDMAVWKMHLMLRIYDYDLNAIDSKLPQLLRFKWYSAKVGEGMGNTGTVWGPTVSQCYERMMAPRSDFVHYYVDLNPNTVVERSSIEDVVDYYKTFKEELDAKKQAKRDGQGVGPTELEIKHERALRDFIIETKSRMRGSERIGDYEIYWVRPDQTNLKVAERHPRLALPLAVSVNYIEASKRNGLYDEVSGKFLVPLSDRQIAESFIDPEHVLHGTVTPDHNTNWAKATVNHLDLFKTSKLEDAENIFPLIEKWPKKPFTQERMFNLGRDFNLLVFEGERRLPKFNGRERAINLAKRSRSMLQDRLRIHEVDVSDLIHLWKTQIVTQSIGRYGMANLQEAAPGNPFPDSGDKYSPPRMSELPKMMLRDEWGGDQDYPDFHHLAETKNKSLIRKRSKTYVPENVCKAAELDGNPNNNKKAETLLILENFTPILGAYLDKYRYKKWIDYEGGVANEDLYNQLETACEECVPLNSALIEQIIVNAVALYEDLVTSAVFGGNVAETRIYTTGSRELVEDMMRDRWILDTPMQLIADIHLLESGDLQRWGTGTASGDDKKS
ncbi:MAG: hypothetical protein ABFQ62_01970 [Patescibacteria group bacterium]